MEKDPYQVVIYSISHLARLVAARASGRGTGQQMLSTYYLYTPSSHQVRTTLPPTLATPIHLP